MILPYLPTFTLPPRVKTGTSLRHESQSADPTRLSTTAFAMSYARGASERRPRPRRRSRTESPSEALRRRRRMARRTAVREVCCGRGRGEKEDGATECGGEGGRESNSCCCCSRRLFHSKISARTWVTLSSRWDSCSRGGRINNPDDLSNRLLVQFLNR